jgi:hypothetical protein
MLFLSSSTRSKKTMIKLYGRREKTSTKYEREIPQRHQAPGYRVRQPYQTRPESFDLSLIAQHQYLSHTRLKFGYDILQA